MTCMRQKTDSENFLTNVREKKKVKINKIIGGKEAQARLSSMGLIPGKDVEIIKNSSHGPMILSLGGSKLVLGRGLANKIRVSLLPVDS